jgi:hypothetical protein
MSDYEYKMLLGYRKDLRNKVRIPDFRMFDIDDLPE